MTFRAVNNNLLDTYQLKSLDAALEANVEEIIIIKDGAKYIVASQPYGQVLNETTNLLKYRVEMAALYDNFAMREPYDRVIRCLGFTSDPSIFEQ